MRTPDGYLSGPAIRGIQEGDKRVNFVEFQDLLDLPFVVSKKGSKKGNHLLQFMISSFSFLICFVFHNELKHLHVMHVEKGLCFVNVSPYLCYRS